MGLTRWLKHGNLHPDFRLPNGNVTANSIDGSKLIAATVTYDKLDEQVLRYTDTTITAAQVANLHTTALAVIAAPGANKAVVPGDVFLYHDYAGGAFGNVAAGDVLELSASSTPANTFGQQASGSGLLDATADAFAIIKSTSAAVAANTAVFLGLAGAVTKDSSTGVLKVRAFYRVVPTNF
jgi:hypothetical protein